MRNLGEVKNAMKLLITAGHNWWVVMPNFVIQEPSLEEIPEHSTLRGPLASEQVHAVKVKGKMTG
jgi:hypothetical protein